MHWDALTGHNIHVKGISVSCMYMYVVVARTMEETASIFAMSRGLAAVQSSLADGTVNVSMRHRSNRNFNTAARRVPLLNACDSVHLVLYFENAVEGEEKSIAHANALGWACDDVVTRTVTTGVPDSLPIYPSEDSFPERECQVLLISVIFPTAFFATPTFDSNMAKYSTWNAATFRT